MKKGFFDRLKSKILIIDGAMGTMLQAGGLKPGGCPEELNLTHPDLIMDIHKEYINVGVDIILSNTFGANRIKLSEYGLEGKIKEINHKGVKLAKKVAGTHTLVASSIGPTGRFVEPVGPMTFDETYNIYKEQVEACIDAGVDILAFETFTDIKELRAAVIAARDITHRPIMAMMTFNEDLRTVLGTNPVSAYITLDALGVDVIGANCGLGPQEMLNVIKEMKNVSTGGLIFEPNAGMPELINGETVFPMPPSSMANVVKHYIDVGVNVIGGCCGTTPEHIKAIAKLLKGLKPSKQESKGSFFVSSRISALEIGSNTSTKIVGERINPTGKAELAEDLRNGTFSIARQMAKAQVQDGAGILDINVGMPGINEASVIKDLILNIQGSVNVPLMLDSQKLDVLEEGLKAADGKVIVNSVNGEEDCLKKILPLVKKYGAAVIGLTLDEKGIPNTSEGRIKIAKKILKYVKDYRIPTNNLIIDSLTLTISTDQGQAVETLNAVRYIKEKMNLSTILGVSNISFGLPNRSVINSAFLSMAIEAGLDLAIINPSSTLIMELLSASSVIVGRDKNAENYINRFAKKKIGPEKKAEVNIPSKEVLFNSILEGDKELAEKHIHILIREGLPPMNISSEILIPALKEVGTRYEKRIFFLPQMMLSAEVMEYAFSILKKNFKGSVQNNYGKILLATVKGDIHDIGKNIVATILRNYGFDIIDMGKSVSDEEILKKLQEAKPDIIGLSALMTTTMTEMEKVISLLRVKGIKTKIMIGGAVITSKFAKDIGADAFAKDGLDAVAKAKELLNLE